MPLRDHFHGWLRQELEWHSFHNAWATFIAATLNTCLPEGYRASPNVQKAIEIDIATYGNVKSASSSPEVEGAHLAEWQPSPGTVTFPFELAGETAEVLVHGYRTGAISRRPSNWSAKAIRITRKLENLSSRNVKHTFRTGWGWLSSIW